MMEAFDLALGPWRSRGARAAWQRDQRECESCIASGELMGCLREHLDLVGVPRSGRGEHGDVVDPEVGEAPAPVGEGGRGLSCLHPRRDRLLDRVVRTPDLVAQPAEDSELAMPSMALPWDSSSSVVTALTRSAGGRNVTALTSVPRRRRDVRAARKPSVV